MKEIFIVLIVVVVSSLIIFFVRKHLTKKYTMELMKAIIVEDMDTFTDLIDSTKIKLLFDPFNREYMRLNCYIAHGQDKKVNEQVSLMDKMRINRKQRYAVYYNVFQYFISTNNETNTRNMQRKMNAFIDENNLDPNIKNDLSMEIKLYFDKDICTLPYIDEHLKNANDQEKAVWNLKKAYVLKENKRLDEALKCMEIVVNCTTDPIQKKEMQALIDNNLKDL